MDNPSGPSVSVCMITYNHENYIRQAIEGVLMQICNFPYEFIIGDDHSKDQTLNICNEYAAQSPDIKLIPAKYNLGITSNFMRTLQASTCKYIALCEGDDYWTDPLKLQKQVDFLESNPEHFLIFTDYDVADNYGKLTRKQLTPKYIKNQSISYIDMIYYTPLTATVMFRNRSHIIKSLNNYSILNDHILFYLISKNGKVAFLNESTAVYRLNLNSIYNPLSNIEKLEKFKIPNLQYLDNLIDKNNPFEVKALNHGFAMGFSNLSLFTFDKRKFNKMLIALFKTFKYDLKGYKSVFYITIKRLIKRFLKQIFLSKFNKKDDGTRSNYLTSQES